MARKDSSFRRVIIGVIGGMVLLVGALLIFLPGPAFIVIPAGLAILATEFRWAKELLSKLKKKFQNKRKTRRRENSAPSLMNREQTMPDDDLDPNVVNLTETKSHRAPSSESLQTPIHHEPQTRKWITAARLGTLGGLLLAAMIGWRIGLKIATAFHRRLK